jgi:hypothetical protein
MFWRFPYQVCAEDAECRKTINEPENVSDYAFTQPRFSAVPIDYTRSRSEFAYGDSEQSFKQDKVQGYEYQKYRTYGIENYKPGVPAMVTDTHDPCPLYDPGGREKQGAKDAEINEQPEEAAPQSGIRKRVISHSACSPLLV